MLSTASQLYLKRNMLSSKNLLMSSGLRSFSAFSKVEGNSISISSQLPPKIRIPISDKVQYDFTLLAEESVKQFEDKVKSACKSSGLSSFKVLSPDVPKIDPNQKIEDVMKAKFQIEVNRSKYDVYPQFETMIQRSSTPEYQSQLDKIFDGRSIPIARRVILYSYFEQFFKHLKPNQQLTEQDLNKALEQALDAYVQDYQDKIYKSPLEQLEKAQKELDEYQKQREQLELKAQKFAGRMILGGFGMAFAQFTGMGYLIFVHYSWEVMEPVTYMVSTFYAAVATYFYLFYKSDFEMATAYDMFINRKYKKLVKKTKFDDQKIEFLENYINELKDQIGILKNEEIERISK